jgi:hypothetical protein
MLQSLKTGDRVICTTQREANGLKAIARDCNIDVECIAIDPSNPTEIHRLGRSKGRTIFDHMWIERRHLACLGSEERWLIETENRLSALDAEITKPLASWKGLER